jgi:hypothetical protein
MVNICILNKELREVIMSYQLPSLVRLSKQTNPDGDVVESQTPKNWTEYLRMLEKNDEIKSIKKLCQRVKRMRKELEFWQKSKATKEAAATNEAKKE